MQVGFQRMSGNPLTPDEVFASRGDAESFCSDPTCYVGKTLAYRDEEGKFRLAIVQEGDPRTLEDLGMGGDVEFTVENKWTDDGYVSTGGALVDGKMVVCGICVNFTKLVPSYGHMAIGSTVPVTDRTFIATLTGLLSSYKAPLYVWLRNCYAPCHFFSSSTAFCFSFPYVNNSYIPMHGCFMLDTEGNITNRSVPMVSYGSANQVLAANGQLVNLPTAVGMLDSITGASETASRKALDNTNGKGTVDTCVELNYSQLRSNLSPSFIEKVRQGMQVSVTRINSSGYDVHYPAAVYIGSDIVISFFESPSSGIQVSLYKYSLSGQYKSNVSFSSVDYLTSSQVDASIYRALIPFYLLNSISFNGESCTMEGYECNIGGLEVGQLYVPDFATKEIIRCTSSSATKSEFHERIPFVKGCGSYMVKHVVAKGTYNGNNSSTIELNNNILDSNSPVSTIGLNKQLNVLSSASGRDLWLEAVPLAYVKEFKIFKSGTGSNFYIRISDENGSMQDVKFKFIIYETDTI